MSEKIMKQEEAAEKVQVEVLDKFSLPEKEDEYTGEVPKDRKTCMTLISASLKDITLRGAARYWYVGKVMAELDDRGEKNVFEEVMKLTGCELRTVKYIKAVYQKFPNFNLITAGAKAGVQWVDYKELLKISDDQCRVKVLKQLISGELKRDDLKEKVQTVKTPKAPKLPDAPVERPSPFKYFGKFKNKIDKWMETCADLSCEFEDFAAIMSSTEEGVSLNDEEFRAAAEALEALLVSVEHMKNSSMTVEHQIRKLREDTIEEAEVKPEAEDTVESGEEAEVKPEVVSKPKKEKGAGHAAQLQNGGGPAQKSAN